MGPTVKNDDSLPHGGVSNDKRDWGWWDRLTEDGGLTYGAYNSAWSHYEAWETLMYHLAFLACAGWEAMQAGRLHPWLCWVDVAEEARTHGCWFWKGASRR